MEEIRWHVYGGILSDGDDVFFPPYPHSIFSRKRLDFHLLILTLDFRAHGFCNGVRQRAF